MSRPDYLIERDDLECPKCGAVVLEEEGRIAQFGPDAGEVSPFRFCCSNYFAAGGRKCWMVAAVEAWCAPTQARLF